MTKHNKAIQILAAFWVVLVLSYILMTLDFATLQESLSSSEIANILGDNSIIYRFMDKEAITDVATQAIFGGLLVLVGLACCVSCFGYLDSEFYFFKVSISMFASIAIIIVGVCYLRESTLLYTHLTKI